MKKLFNDGWEFTKQRLHTTFDEISGQKEVFQSVGIPHDWLIYQHQDLYEDGTGWYRKKFFWKKSEKERVSIRFDGVYMDSKVYVNREMVQEWKYGYSAFETDITEALVQGENEILVSVDFQAPNSRWYSGAGIYRNVWLRTVPQEHILADGIYFSAQKNEEGWQVKIHTEIVGGDCRLSYSLREKGHLDWVSLEGEEKQDETGYLFEACVKNPKEWDIESPVCYELKVELYKYGELLQTEVQTVGFRTLKFSSLQGFFLNGKRIKLNGVCEHHDLGCLGAAYHTQAMRRKLRILKEMGVNAIRTSHNMPAEDVMDLADEMGLLIISEAFDCWESSKNPYDYGRFFPQWYPKDVASWVRRDRNHPSLIMWSIGNEIYDTHVNSEKGKEWIEKLMYEVRIHDPYENGALTLGSNYMPWENTQKCAEVIKLIGYNYGEKYYDEHHEKHPDWIIYGSETGSIVQSRGIYHFPYQQSVLADEDEQCSSLGNSTTSWGAKSTEACILAERDHPFSCGQFIWTGFDYIGEPTPYHTRNSYFGQVDTAGFPKDSYYIYQAAWTDYKKSPMVHIFPYWDFNEGQFIDIRVCSNAPAVELFFNGKSQGTFSIDHEKGTDLVGHWQLPYKKGEIRAIAFDSKGKIVAEEIRHSFGEAAAICLKPEQEHLFANGEDLLFLVISMEDKDGYPVENANNRVNISVEGAGALVGTDNGDSTDTDGYKEFSRRLFSGKLLAVLKAGTEPGILRVRVSSPQLPEKVLELPVIPDETREGISDQAYLAGTDFAGNAKSEIPVRKICMSSSNGLHLHEGNLETVVRAKICPDIAEDQEVYWSIVDDAGIPLKIAQIQPDGLQVKVTAKSDGQFRLRCMSKCGTNHIRIISQMEFMITGLGTAFTNPYEFVSAGLYDYSKGSIGNGNEHGVATARDGESQVGFHDIDFGAYGSDEIRLPIFALTDDPYEIDIYEGMPDEGGVSLGHFVYQMPKKWNVYQDAVYHLNKRLRGVTSLCFVFREKVHLKGFSFKKYNRAWQQIPAGECDHIYGDSFLRDGTSICEIGNNVTMKFTEMEFGEEGFSKLRICGSTPLEKNTIILCFTEGEQEERCMLEFVRGEEIQEFELDSLYSTKDVSFIFLPGSNFNFKWFQFLK